MNQLLQVARIQRPRTGLSFEEKAVDLLNLIILGKALSKGR